MLKGLEKVELFRVVFVCRERGIRIGRDSFGKRGCAIRPGGFGKERKKLFQNSLSGIAYPAEQTRFRPSCLARERRWSAIWMACSRISTELKVLSSSDSPIKDRPKLAVMFSSAAGPEMGASEQASRNRLTC